MLQTQDTPQSQDTDTEDIGEQFNDSSVGVDDDTDEPGPSHVPRGGGGRKKRKEDTPAVSFITSLTDFLEESESRRERRRRQHEEEGRMRHYSGLTI